MNRRKNMLGLLLGLAVLGGCASMKPVPVRVEVESSSEVKLTNVEVHMHGEGLHVLATLRPTSAVARRTGHVDVEFYDAEGTRLAMVQAEPNVAHFSRSSARKPEISVQTTLTPESVASVRLKHHPDAFDEGGH